MISILCTLKSFRVFPKVSMEPLQCMHQKLTSEKKQVNTTRIKQ